MAVTIFAAIDVGSYEVSMDIYQISPKIGIEKIDEVRSRIELGHDTYTNGKISYESAQRLGEVLGDFSRIMKEYKVTSYRACATSTLQEARNVWIVLEQVYQRTGIRVEILSNSEQRFFGYKSIAAKEADFSKIIQKGTAIIEIGGGNVQISLFDKDTLVTTQNFKMGSLRIRERLLSVEKETIYYEKLVEELIHNDILSFKKLHLKERKVDNIILLGDFFMEKLLVSDYGMGESRTVSKAVFMEMYERIVHKSAEQLSVELGITLEYASILVPALIIYRVFADEMGAQNLWVPGTQLNDGIAYDYAQGRRLIRSTHNFENDILACAQNIAKRYMSSKSHVRAVLKVAETIFDSMRRVHGMGPRERLLLQIAVILHDCGKYISMSEVAKCSYEIIMSTEIIGLSHAEREMIANIVRFNNEPFKYYGEADSKSTIDRDTYMIIGKMTAILRVANALDRSHKQKAENIKVQLQDKELVLVIDTQENLLLEEGLLTQKADFFEEMFNIRPVLRRKKRK